VLWRGAGGVCSGCDVLATRAHGVLATLLAVSVVGVRTAVESELPVRDCGTGGAGSIRLFFGPTRALFGGESGSTSSSDSQFRARFCRETFFSVSDDAVSRSDVSSAIFAF